MLSRHWMRLRRRSVPARCLTRLSIRRGPSEPALFRGTIPDHFASIVSRYGDRPAVVARAPSTAPAESILTYHALDLMSNRLARSLSSLGVRKGHRVAVSLGNGVEFAALTYAIYKLGAVLVPLNPTFSADQVGSALRHLGAEVLVIGAVTDLAYKPGRGRSNAALLRHLVEDLRSAELESDCIPCLRRVIVVDNTAAHPDLAFGLDLEGARALIPYRAMLEGSDRPVKPEEALRPDDTINIQFTSGTTSAPKAAMLSHESILNNGRLIAHRMGLDPSDRIVVPPPLFHCFGSILGYMATATTGAAILFPSPAFDPAATLDMCTDHDATGLYGVSTMFIAVLEALDQFSSSSSSSSAAAEARRPRHLRKGIAAGSSVPESLMGRIFERLGLHDLVICYGMTETAPVSCMTRPSDPLPMRCSSVGTPMPHTTVKIVSPTDRSKMLPLNTPGELATKGYLVMRGYYGDPQRTAEVLVHDAGGEKGGPVQSQGNEGKSDDDGPWMYTGDEAQMDDNGFVRITGRIKELIIRGGENIHPLEVEECIYRIPGVQEVSVCGVPDERLGEAVAAFIIPRQGYAVTEQANRGAQDCSRHAESAAHDERDEYEFEYNSSSSSSSSSDDRAKNDRGARPPSRWDTGSTNDTTTTTMTTACTGTPGTPGAPGARTISKAAVRAHVARLLSAHLVPKYVFWVREYPKTASGKIQRFRLRDMVRERLHEGL